MARLLKPPSGRMFRSTVEHLLGRARQLHPTHTARSIFRVDKTAAASQVGCADRALDRRRSNLDLAWRRALAERVSKG